MKPLQSATRHCSAVVLGSTGNVGRQIVNLLARTSAVSQVVVINRRDTAEFRGMPKVLEVVVPDMGKLAQAAQSAVQDAGATVGFCAIGVGKGSQEMPEEEVRRIEVQYPEDFARGCKAGGVHSMGLMTAVGSNTRSSFTYVRIMGEKERTVAAVALPALGIYRPSVIFGNSNTPSYLRRLFPAVQWALPSRYHAIHKNELARAMFEGTLEALAALQLRTQRGAPRDPEVKYYEYGEMKPFFNRDDPKD